MTKTKAKPTAKLALSKAVDIPYNKLAISDANVRQVTAGLSIEDLAAAWDTGLAAAVCLSPTNPFLMQLGKLVKFLK